MNPHNWLRHRDWLLLLATVLLVGISLIILQSVNFKDPSLVQHFDPNKQILFAVIGCIFLTLFSRIDYHVWLRFARSWYGIGLGLLVLVFFLGSSSQGATRWIDIGPLQFQPAEFIKIGLIMVLARLFTEKHDELPRLRYLGMALALVVVPAFLIIIQPDLGSTLAMGFVWIVMVLGSNINKLHLAGLVLAGLLVLPLVVSQLHPYQIKRIESFTNPLADPQGAGYNVLQSTIAVGSGRFLGKGLSSGSQSQLNFLPSQQTDFIFAVLSEKLGFLGSTIVLLLFGLLLSRGLLIAWQANDRFGMLLALGITAMFLFHIVINIGMNLGIMPVTGIPLPLVSYGGTNLIVSLMAIGILQSIYFYRKKLEFQT